MMRAKTKRFDPMVFDTALRDFDTKRVSGALDSDVFPDLPDLPPAPADGEDTVALLVPRKTS